MRRVFDGCRRFVLPGAVVLAVLGAIWVPALAQTSLDDALKIIDQARGTAPTGKGTAATVSFVPPPRAITDITAILEKQKPDPAKVAANRAAADATPPAGAQPAGLAEFYFRRGLAATEAGRTPQRLADFKQAVELAKQANVQPSVLMPYLQRLGNAYDASGDLKTAIELQNERLRLMKDSQLPKAFLFNIWQNKVSYAARLGRMQVARDGLAQLEKLLVQSANWPNPTPIARDNFRTQVLVARAVVAQQTGRYAEAEAAAREAMELASGLIPHEPTMNVPAGTFANVRDVTEGQLAAALMTEGRLAEAEAEARRALLSRLQRFGHYSPETAGDTLLLARVLFEQRRPADTEKLADAARDIFESLGYSADSQGSLNALSWIARAQLAQGKNDVARVTYDKIERAIGTNADLRRRYLEADTGYALMLVRTDRAAEAVAILERGLERVRTRLGDRSYATATSHGWLGVALTRAGQGARARTEFETAMPILLSRSREAESDDSGSSVAQRERGLQLIVEAYLGLLADGGGTVASETFRLADAVRGRSVERALAESSARAGTGDAVLGGLVRHEQDAEKQVAALQGVLTNLLSQPTSEQDPGEVEALRKQIDGIRGARARVREEIERRFPSYATLVDPRSVTAEEAQKILRPGEALIATYVGDERLFVWAVPQQGPVAFASTKIRGREVERMIKTLRTSLDANVASIEEMPAFDLALAYKLYTLILQPVMTGWSGARSLMVVPHQSLGQIPFSLLVTEPATLAADSKLPFAGYRSVPFLVRKVAVTQLPSVASLATLRALPAPKATRQTFAGFGDPWFNPEQARQARAESAGQTHGAPKTAALQTRGIPLIRRSGPTTEGAASAEISMLPRLPDTAEEVRSIALALHADPAKDVFLGAQASEKNATSAALGNRRIIVFATHGLVPGDLNGLTQPALALSNPAVAGGGGNGLLTVEKILALKLDADWVVLSACNTAAAQGGGAEAVSGLGRAFFYAGTRALLVSNWPVETVSARTLTTDLFRREAETPALPRGEALRQAELALIDGPGAIDPASKAALFSYAHPIFWAPFTLVGDGG
jgi:CHAT domain-containing protein/tetratricopeptide (TPR) repeat protein